MKIGILLPNWVGDLTMSTPMLRSIHQAYPGASIFGIGKPHMADLLKGAPWLTEYIPCNHQQWTGSNGFIETVQTLRRERLDIILSLRATMRGALMSITSGASFRIGMHSDAFAQAYHLTNADRRSDPSTPMPLVDRYLELASLLNGTVDHKRLELFCEESDRQAVDHFLREHPSCDPDRIVMINGCSAGRGNRLWPQERFIELARRMSDEYDYSVILNCSPSDQARVAELAERIDRTRVFTLAESGDLSFGFLKALLQRAAVLVTIDSGPRHVAAAMGTPVVSLLGPIDPLLTANYHAGETVVTSPKLDCMPCNSNRCRLSEVLCMRGISVGSVIHAALAAAEGVASSKAAVA